MIQGVVDPGTPSFRATEVHDFLMPFQSDVVLDITDRYANEVFGAEALREALEEVDLKENLLKIVFIYLLNMMVLIGTQGQVV